MNTWSAYLEIQNHPFLASFQSPTVIRSMYEHATYGLPRIFFGRPKNWYDRARSTDVAIERFGEMVVERLSYGDTALEDDLLQALERCEDPESIDLIERIFNFYHKSPYDPAEYTQARIMDEPATESQRRFLKKLGIRNFSGTKTQASRKIDEILAERDQTK